MPLIELYLALNGALPAFCCCTLFISARKLGGLRFSLCALLAASLILALLLGSAISLGMNLAATTGDAVILLSLLFVPLLLWWCCGILFRRLKHPSEMVSAGDVIIGVFLGLGASIAAILLSLLMALVSGQI